MAEKIKSTLDEGRRKRLRGDDKYPLSAALASLGWSGLQAARRLRVNKNTVVAWLAKPARVPGPARAYLDLRLALKSLEVL